MKIKLYFLTVLLFPSLSGAAQVTLEGCYRKGRENYPLIRQKKLIEQAKEYNLSNASKGYLPQMQFTAKASYQSDVTKVPLKIEGIEAMNKDQYGLTLDLSQTIWDGGEIQSKKQEIRTASEVDQSEWEVNMYTIRDRINQLYFGILLLDAQLRQNDLYQEDLKENYDKIESYVENGVAHQADLDAVKVEWLKAKQSRVELVQTRSAYLDMLSSFVGEDLPPEAALEKPAGRYATPIEIARPELARFDAQIKNFEAQHNQVNAGLMPKLGLFATGGYGRPSLDMLANDFEAYFVGGIRLSWNIGNFYTQKGRKRLIATGIRSVETQRETFLFNTRQEVTRNEKEIASYREQLQYDDEIIALRTSVRRSSEAKMANGTLSGIDLVRDIHAEYRSIEDKNLHEIEMLLALYHLKFITNH